MMTLQAFKTFFLAIVFMISGLVQATPTADSVPGFYQWQDDMPEGAGVLLRQQALEEQLVLEEAAQGLRILYTSDSWDEQPVEVSGAVFLPRGKAPEGGWPVMAWSHGTVGVADVCAPSLAGRSNRDVRYLNKWLKAGYAIVATDYEGLGTPGNHPYLHCQSEANSNIDAVRAAQQLDLPLSGKWMVTGQSQGGQGALCTGAYAGKRAPELNFLGTLATAPGVNFIQRFRHGHADDPNPYIGVSLFLARGFETYEPGFESKNAFTDKALALLPYTEKLCYGELVGMGMKAGLTSGQSMQHIPFSETPGVAEAAKQMEIPLNGWSQPVYIAQGTEDELVRAEDVYDLARDLCARGATVTLDVYEGANHSGPVNKGFDNFVKWVDERFAGSQDQGNCEDDAGQ